jgi:glycosyltransferase involved in cell wall biosynthesis
VTLALVSHYLPPSRYGQPRVIQRLLARSDPSSYCLLSTQPYDRNDPQPDHDAPWLPGPYVRLPDARIWTKGATRRPFYRFSPLVNAFPAILARAGRIAQIVRERDLKVVVACSGDIADLPAAWIAARRTGRAFVPYMFDDYVEQWSFNPLLRSLAAAMEKRFVGDAARVVVPNEFLRDTYRDRYRGAIDPFIIHNPYAEGAASDEPAPPARDPDGRARIVYTGSIYHVHFDAFRNLTAGLAATKSRAKLVLYSATAPDVLRANGIDGFEHMGHVSDAEALDVQRRADVLFLPLAFKSAAQDVVKTSAPGKMGEYLTSGRPVLVHAPDDSFVNWYFREHRCGEVVARPEPDALAAAIDRMVLDAGYARVLADAAMAQGRLDFDPAVARARFAELLDTVVPAP